MDMLLSQILFGNYLEECGMKKYESIISERY